MSKEYTAVVDFGTQKITVAVGYLSRDGLSIVGSGETEYGGYLDGEFLQMDKLGEAIQNAIKIAENNSGVEINSVVVGVPSAFATVVCKDVVQNYNKKIRISEKVIESLYDMGDDFSQSSAFTLISADALEFSLDDGMPRIDCLGLTTTKLKAKVSYILAENKFINLITEITNILGLEIEKFICTALAEYKYLIDNSLDTNVIVDCGHLSTSMAICRGNGIEALAEFSLGGGFITSDIMRWLKLDYKTSDMLKRKVVLSIIPNEQDVYEVKNGDDVVTLSAYTANSVVVSKVEKIANTTVKCIDKYRNLIDENTKFYLCGGGLSYIKGAKEIVSRIIGRKIDIICPNIPQLARPHYSAVLSLLYVACKNSQVRRKFIFLSFKF
ncbi:MAG: cell division FtsA domain-containing protein [Christensenellales bacterium]